MSDYEYAVKWEAIGDLFPEEIHTKPSKGIAERAVADSAFPGVIVRRIVSEWEDAS